ncbi:MAG: hypothetical protein HY951_04000 [Bacteroidia bacterium]|nr:hypothetical protein [Bacteroidia bacterium]
MEKKDLPQDPSHLDKFTTEVCYVTDESGKYTTTQSRGWEVKATALDVAWKDIETRLKEAFEAVKNKEASPILFYMEKKLMDLTLVSSYTGFWKWQVKRHLKPTTFNKLPESKLQKYAQLFEVNINELKNPSLNAD